MLDVERWQDVFHKAISGYAEGILEDTKSITDLQVAFQMRFIFMGSSGGNDKQRSWVVHILMQKDQLLKAKKIIKAFLHGPEVWHLVNNFQLILEWCSDLGPETRALVEHYIMLQGCVKQSLCEI